MQKPVHSITELVSLNGDEYYTLPEHVMDISDNLAIPIGSNIWCPFDTESSEFVKILRNKGYNVKATHIDTGNDFFETPPPIRGLCNCFKPSVFKEERNTHAHKGTECKICFAFTIPLVE